MAINIKLRLPLTPAPLPRDEADEDLYLFLSRVTGITISTCQDSDDRVDYEDWIEPICLLASAINSGYETRILKHDSITEPLVTIPGKPCPEILLGPIPTSQKSSIDNAGYVWPRTNDFFVERYAELKTFRIHAGRTIILADMPGEKCTDLSPFGEGRYVYDHLGEAMLQFHEKPYFIKQVRPAKSLPLINMRIANGLTPNEAISEFVDRVEFHIARYEGERNALLLQEKIAMTHETRFFIVDHSVICGAACIEENTPRKNPFGDKLPPIFEINRNGEDRVRSETVANCLMSAAQQIAQDIKNEEPRMRDYVLDLALDENDNPIIIECNPLSNSGLYALDTDRLVTAIVQATS